MNQFSPVSILVGSELAEVAEKLQLCTVEVRGSGGGRGSGVIWRHDGLIVTNAHVATLPRHTLELSDGRVFDADVIRRDLRSDLAALQVDASALPTAESRDASSLRTGELVLAVGNPSGACGAFTVGVVAGRSKPTDDLMHVDIRLAPGNSGGPLADARGRVVGLNSMVVGGFGVAVTSTAIERFLAASGRRSIGVTLQVVGLRRGKLPAPGLMVVALDVGGAAHLSGLLVGDVILRVNGKSLSSPNELEDAIQAAAPLIVLDVLRNGRVESCSITVNQESVAEVA